jgi:hypothetical protein
MKYTPLCLFIFLANFCGAQDLYFKNNGSDFERKLYNTFQFEYNFVKEADKAHYTIEAFFSGKYDLVKAGFKCRYVVYNKSGKKIYTSDEFRSDGVSMVAQNSFIQRIVFNDFPDVFEELKTRYSKKKIKS